MWGNQLLVANAGNKKSSFYSDTEGNFFLSPSFYNCIPYEFS